MEKHQGARQQPVVIADRRNLLTNLDTARRIVDRQGDSAGLDDFRRQALDMEPSTTTAADRATC